MIYIHLMHFKELYQILSTIANAAAWTYVYMCGVCVYIICVSMFLLNPIQARGHIVHPYQNYRPSSKQLGVWSFCFMTFLSGNIPFRKFQFHQSALMVTIQLFSIIFKTRISIVFQVLYFHLIETSCEITFYALDIIIL